MNKLLSIAWEYFVPLCFFLLAFDAYLGDPNTRILKSFPVVPGEHKDEWALGLAVVGSVLAFAVYKHKRTIAGDQQ